MKDVVLSNLSNMKTSFSYTTGPMDAPRITIKYRGQL